jgi:four helix bundle protein
MTVMNLDKLEIWQRACDFTVTVYKNVLPKLPAEEKWNLASQIRRSAQSIPANIAEGHGRYHFLDNVRFCYIARGSLTELISHISLAKKLGFLSDDLMLEMNEYAESIGKQLNQYISYLKRTKVGEKDFPRGYKISEEQENYLISSEYASGDEP